MASATRRSYAVEEEEDAVPPAPKRAVELETFDEELAACAAFASCTRSIRLIGPFLSLGKGLMGLAIFVIYGINVNSGSGD